MDFTDVTLASEDGQQVEAHRLVLPAKSLMPYTVFRSFYSQAHVMFFCFICTLHSEMQVHEDIYRKR